MKPEDAPKKTPLQQVIIALEEVAKVIEPLHPWQRVAVIKAIAAFYSMKVK